MTAVLVPLKHLVAINARSLPEDTPSDRPFRYVEISTCGRGRLETEPEWTTFGEAPSRARRLVQTGDCLISTVRTYLRAVWPIRESAEDLVVSTGFAVLSPRRGIDARYLGWLVQSDVVIDEVVARSVGVSYPGVNASEIGEIAVPVPSAEEQRAISDYLDAETARIDLLCRLNLESADLLSAKRRALILALTEGGSDSDVARGVASAAATKLAARLEARSAEALGAHRSGSVPAPD